MYRGFLYPVAGNTGVRLTDIAGTFQALVAVMVTGAFLLLMNLVVMTN